MGQQSADPKSVTCEGLEQLVLGLVRMLGASLDKEYGPRRVGCALFLFDYGEGGHRSYSATADRGFMIKTLDEFLERMRASRTS